jgi:Zn-dependent M28 family amino/carboxypeptidase
MGRAAFLVLVLTAVAPVSCGGGSDGSATSASTSVAFDTARAMADVNYLVNTIGPRPAGSPGAEAAAKYISDELGKAHFGVLRASFTYETDPNRPAALRAGSDSIEAATVAGSPSTSASGTPVLIGAGDAAGLGGRRIDGKVAVATRGGGTFAEKLAVARQAGAVALVLVNNDTTPLLANLGRASDIPVVGVGASALARLKAAESAGAPVTVSVPAGETVTDVNVIARPADGHACEVIVAAHYDTLPGSTGANDNASGVAAMLEVARQLGGTRPPSGLCFIAFGAKFAGLQGSKAYVATLKPTTLPAAVIDLYALGTAKEVQLIGDGRLQADAVALAASLKVAVRQAGANAGIGTDGEVLREAGVTAIDLTSLEGQGARQSADTLAAVDSANLARVGQLAAALASAVLKKGGP